MAYTPASMTTASAGLTHQAAVYYERVALSKPAKRFMFWRGLDPKVLGLRNGKTVQYFRYSQLGANTVATAEGAVGTPIDMAASTTLTATVAQYADFISLSDMVVDTIIDDIIAEAVSQAGYRAGLSCDNINKAEIDSLAGAIDVLPVGDYFSGSDLAGLRTRFAGLDVKPLRGGYFTVIAHPYVTYDLIHDPEVGGFKDIMKQGGSLEPFNQEDRGFVCRFNSCEVWESTNVTSLVGPPVKYRAYAFAQEAMAGLSLQGRGPTPVEDPERQSFRLNVSRNEKPSVANPEGKIRAFVSYNFVYVAKNLNTAPYHMRKIDFESGLGL